MNEKVACFYVAVIIRTYVCMLCLPVTSAPRSINECCNNSANYDFILVVRKTHQSSYLTKSILRLEFILLRVTKLTNYGTILLGSLLNFAHIGIVSGQLQLNTNLKVITI